MKKSLCKEEELLNSIDKLCDELDKTDHNTDQFKQLMSELNYNKILLQKTIRKRKRRKYIK